MPDKFITIPYDEWENKYKPLEVTNARLEYELAVFKAEKELQVYVNVVTFGAKRFQKIKVGSVEITGCGSGN